MDLHKASDYAVKPTVDEIKRNHIADLAVQEKYGVKFLQYWINEEAGMVFCLMEAPDKESCAAVHQEAHGGMPCNVIELKGGDYIGLMSDDFRINDFDIVERPDGLLDTGNRIILALDFISITVDRIIPESVERIINNSGAALGDKSGHREILFFTSFKAAIECALAIVNDVRTLPAGTTEVRIGVSAGEPVTDRAEIFADALRHASLACDIAENGQVVISSQVTEMANEVMLQNYRQEQSLKVLEQPDEEFLSQVIEKARSLLSEPDFTIDDLGKKLAVSRSRLYRKITTLTGHSANSFIRELRLQKAFKLLRSKQGNITQVALDVGIANPSYFTRIFQERFAVAPLKILKLNG
jgi:AraC-like DNA-binding protein